MKIFVLLLFIAAAECVSCRNSSPMNDDIYKTIVKLVEDSSNVPCPMRTTVEQTAITQFYRKRERYSGECAQSSRSNGQDLT